MRKARLAALLAAVMIGVTALPTVPAFAYTGEEAAAESAANSTESKGNNTESAVDNTESKADSTESVKESAESGTSAKEAEDSASALSPLPFDAELLGMILPEIDEETIEFLMDHPKLLVAFIPTLHVTLTESSLTIAVDTNEPAEDPARTGTVTTNGSNLNVRSGAGIDFNIIGKLANGTEITVKDEKDGWYRIEFPAEYAYVCGRYVKLNEIPVKETQEGTTFDIDGKMILSFLKTLEELFPEAPEAPEIHGLTPDGNLTLVDDIGPVTGEGQQFITLVTKAGNYFYLVIDRDEKGEETVHFLNLVDERDLFTLMEEDEQNAYNERLAAEQAAREAAKQAAKESETAGSGEGDGKTGEEQSSGGRRNMLPFLLIPLILAGAGGGWFYLQTKKKKQAASAPDPDADYSDDEDEEDYSAGDAEEEPVNDGDYGDDPYEAELLGDDADADGGIPEETEEA